MVSLKNVLATVALLATAEARPANNVRDTPSKYIVKLKDDASDFKSHVSWVSDIFGSSLTKRDLSGLISELSDITGFQGYTGEFDDATLDQIKGHSDVDYVEKSQIWTTLNLPEKRNVVTQGNATWGLAAVSSRKPGATGYKYDSNTGAGSYAYVIDSGVRVSHKDFNGRAVQGWTGYGSDYSDGVGHGTHVAGTIASTTYGVAKKANVVAVKVLDETGHGDNSIIIKGIEWAAHQIISNNRQNNAIINLSLGGPKSRAVNDLIAKVTGQGVVVVVAAGNNQGPASELSPASAPSAITVGAVTKEWAIATKWPRGQGSNYGPILDLFAPGDNIISLNAADDTSSVAESGTSMATPHISGLALAVQSVQGIHGPANVAKALVSQGTKNAVSGPLRGSPNVEAYNNIK